TMYQVFQKSCMLSSGGPISAEPRCGSHCRKTTAVTIAKSRTMPRTSAVPAMGHRARNARHNVGGSMDQAGETGIAGAHRIREFLYPSYNARLRLRQYRRFAVAGLSPRRRSESPKSVGTPVATRCLH